MLLALDAGNSNITIGAFEGSKLMRRWRVRTINEQTADEWGVLMRNRLLSSPESDDVDGIVISSVVPKLDQALAVMGERYFGTTPLFVTPDTDIGIEVKYNNPMELGADRVVNAVAGSICTVALPLWLILAQLSTSTLFRQEGNTVAA